MKNEAVVRAAIGVLDAHISALNATDEAALAATMHFPHHRLSGSNLKIWPTEETYFDDFRKRAGGNWARSSFDDVRVVGASETKVHLDVEVNRFDKSDRLITSFRSLWVVTFENDKWAAKFRSSFAAK